MRTATIAAALVALFASATLAGLPEIVPNEPVAHPGAFTGIAGCHNNHNLNIEAWGQDDNGVWTPLSVQFNREGDVWAWHVAVPGWAEKVKIKVSCLHSGQIQIGTWGVMP